MIGSGLAGLTAAISLRKAGHEVDIVEAAAAIGYIGAGIQISPNSSRVLRHLGVDKYIEPYVLEPIDLKMMSWKSGEVLVHVPLKEPAKEYGSPYWYVSRRWTPCCSLVYSNTIPLPHPRHIHRADLHRGLQTCAIAYGCRVHLDSRVVDIDPLKPSLTTKNGAVFTPDLIVASDGLHSYARSVVVGKLAPPIPTGQMVYRITVPIEKLKGIPDVEDFINVSRNNHWLGPHGTILSYLLKGVHGTLINFVFTYVPSYFFLIDSIYRKRQLTLLHF